MSDQRRQNVSRDTMTVGRLRELLRAFEDDAIVVVPCGMGYEEPKIELANVRPVLVPHRYVPVRSGGMGVQREPVGVVYLKPVNG